MTIKKFLLEVEEGKTLCHKCPFKETVCTEKPYNIINCNKYNFATIKIKEIEDKQIMKDFFKYLLFRDMGNFGEGWWISILIWVMIILLIIFIFNI